jgi:mRNA interferase RelE/StbE
MAVYRVTTASRRVEKEIADLPRETRERIVKAVRRLAENPRMAGSRKLSGEMQGAWRIRVGDYRVIYDVDDERQQVTVLGVFHRREAYR